MRRIISALLALVVIGGQCSAQKYFEKQKLSTPEDSLSYAIGVVMVRNFSEQGIENLSPTVLGKAFYDAQNAKTMAMDYETSEDFIYRYLAKISEAKLAVAREKEQEFLQSNLNEPGVKATESGLQYIVVKEGNGKKPTMENSVKVRFEGKLADGTMFASNFEEDEPTQFNLDNLISGMCEGIMLMSEGAEYTLFIPSELGYGEYSPDEIIPPCSTLIFDIVLVSVEDKVAEEAEEIEAVEEIGTVEGLEEAAED